MGFKLFLESLSISQWRNIYNDTKSVAWKNRYKDIFINKSRITIPYTISPQELKKSLKTNKFDENETYDVIQIILNKIGYDINDYEKGLASHMDNPKKIIKIGKLLQNIEKKDRMDKFLEKIDSIIGAKKGYIKRVLGDYSYKTLMERYANDPKRMLGKIDPNNLQIILSRHPYDIAGMSTGRGWTSCMRIGEEQCSTIKNDIEHGTLVAYLVKKDDTNIEHPIARILVKPYFKMRSDKPKDQLTIGDYNLDDYYLKASPNIYGEFTSQSFPNTVQDFLNNFQLNKEGKYYLHHELYKDRLDTYSIEI